MDNDQGQQEPTVNPQGTQPANEPNAQLPDDVQKYVVQPPATDANPQGAQPQGQTAQQNTAAIDLGKEHFQRLADQRLAENYRLQQELENARRQAPQPVSPDENPYDPNVDWFNALKWEQKRSAKQAAQEAMQGIVSYAQQQAQINSELQWQQQHPNVDINQVKMFAQQRGIRDVNDAYTLLTLQNQLQSAQITGVQQGIHQFRQPQQTATPLRGGQPAGGAVQLRYADMQRDYIESKGKVYESWSSELQKAFDAETYRRSDASAGR